MCLTISGTKFVEIKKKKSLGLGINEYCSNELLFFFVYILKGFKHTLFIFAENSWTENM